MTDEVMDFSGWKNQEKPQEINLSEMDMLVRQMVEARARRDEQADILKGFQASYDEAKSQVLKALQSADKKNYSVSGVGMVIVRKTLAVQTPKTIEDKKALFKYIVDRYGGDVLTAKVSMPYQSLNAFFNEEASIARENGEAFFQLPGVGAPVEDFDVSFRAEKKKG